MSGPFDEKLTDDQREAAGLRYIDTEDTGKEVARKAQAGELTLRGEPVGAFEIAPSYAAQLGARIKKQRLGHTASKAADLPHRDAIEVLRRRLIAVAESVVADLEKKAARDPANLDLERHRQAVRCVFEASKLPTATSPAPPSEHTRDTNGQKGPRTMGGMAGALLKEHRAQTAPAQDNTHSSTDSGDVNAAHHAHDGEHAQQHGEPGSLTHVQGRELEGLAVGG
jgi:hypothetical protein